MDENMSIVQWRDKRLITILSTMHSDSPIPTERRNRLASGGREVVEKPEAVLEYIKFMGGVDHGDQLLSYYGHIHQPHQPLARLTERHFPAQLEKSGSGAQLQRNCVVCSNKKGRGRKTTTFKCKQCDLPMCVVPCFELYHTKVDPQRYL